MTRYTDETRAMSLVMLEAAGYPDKKGALMRTAKELKIPHNTLSQWYRAKSNPPPSELRQIKKEDIVELIKNEIYGALGAMGNARPDADYRELATAIGILTDKLQILTGQPTERIDNMNWQDRAIADIKAGHLSYEALVDAFDDSLASELFARAGVPVSTE